MPQTVHAAYKVGKNQHITLFYRNCCNYDTIARLRRHLERLPTGRKVLLGEYGYLDNPDEPDDPLWVVYVQLLDSEGNVDTELMDRIAEFSNLYSWRASLDKQYQYKMHITLGPFSQLGLNPQQALQSTSLVTGDRYYKLHDTKEKVVVE